jgi:hypothetical protein
MQLENFKAFGQRTVIPLAPITLIFGQNSSGKSSILQSLSLLKQTRNSRDVEALLLPRTDGGIVDLGSFQEMLFDHDLDRTLVIRLDVTLDSKRYDTWMVPPYLSPEQPLSVWLHSVKRDSQLVPRFLSPAKAIGLEFRFSRRNASDEITLEGFNLCSEEPNGSIATFEKCIVPLHSLQMSLSGSRTRQAVIRAARCKQVVDDPTYWKQGYDVSIQKRPRILEGLTAALKRIPKLRRSSPDKATVTDDDNYKLLALLKDYINLFSSDFSYESYVQIMIQRQVNQIIGLDGFIPTSFFGRDGPDPLHDIGRKVFGAGKVPGHWSPYAIQQSALFAGQVVEQTLSAMFPLGPFRKPPSRWYIFTGTTPKDVGYQGHLLPDLLFRNSDLLANANEWLKKLDIGYKIKFRGGRSSDLFELLLMDSRRKDRVEIGLSDVGFGISQILPFIVQSLAATDQIITIEQPEVHIHPRLQADLGDLLIESIQEPRRNQFIVETHSEHLALRLQRRVREKKLSPSDISIIYVSRGPNGATVQPLRLDEEGDFMDDFPGGFFPERLDELR